MTQLERTTGSVWTRKPARQIGTRRFERYVVRTHLVRPGERLTATLLPYLAGQVRPDDIVVVGEKVVAIAEGRAIPLRAVRPRPLARWLARYVRPLGYGLGLRRPETMEMALREAGVARILLAAAVAAVGRLLGRSGDFYRIAGRRVASIDGPGPTTIPPYNRYIVLAPRQSQNFADGLARRLGCGVAVVDVNDVGSEVLAHSAGVDASLVRELLRDNPMGQGGQRTPVAVLRPAATADEPRWPRLEPPRPHPLPAAVAGLGFGLEETEPGSPDAHVG